MMLGAVSFSSNLNAQCATSAQLTNPPLVITCSNSTSTLNLSLDGDFDFIQWFRNGSLISSGTSTTLPYNKWTVGNFRAVAVCNGTPITSNTVAVNRVNITNLSATNRICFGEFVVLQVPLVPGYAYEWRSGGSFTGATVFGGNSHIASVNTTGNIWCRVTAPDGCFKFEKFVVLPKANCAELLTIIVPDNPYFICGGSEEGFLTIDFPSTPDSVQWFRNNQYIQTKFGANALNFRVDRWSVGTFRAIVYQGIASQNTASVDVNRFRIINEGGSNRLCPGEEVTLVGPTFTSEPAFYTWRLGGETSTSGNIVLQGVGQNVLQTGYVGNIFLTITHRGCSKFDKFVTIRENNCPENSPRPEDEDDIIAGKNDMSVLSTIAELNAVVYPNPSNGQFKISLTGLEVNSTTKISIFDFNGRLVAEKVLNANSIETEVSFNESKLSKGFYFANITNSDAQKVVKIAVN